MTSSVVLNPNLVAMEYAVRGPIPARAAELRAKGRRIIPCNIGNPQALGQPPISFYRQVLGLLEEPSRIARERRLLAMPDSSGLRSEDLASPYVLDLAEEMLKGFETGMGAYTESKGPRFVREAVARYIDGRDALADGRPARPADPEAIFLTNGASEGAMNVLELFISGPGDGVMIPIPQYPLYSAAIRKTGGVQVSYYPDEEAGWTLSRAELESAYEAATQKGVKVKIVVVINPGNPTGAVMPPESLQEVIAFARARGLAILADEVYQHNIYSTPRPDLHPSRDSQVTRNAGSVADPPPRHGGEWMSFAKALGDATDVSLFSLHSTSKGFYGECGHRGGYLEVRNPPGVQGSDLSFTDVLYKRATVGLCPNTVGQALTYLVVSPPPQGSPPHEAFVRERDAVLSALHEKATLIRGAFTEMDGVRCFGCIGAMYLFPRLERLPEGTTDFDYCMALLEDTGLVTVNGSGFGQKPGTSHLRIAFLPPREMLAEVLPRWIAFHNKYVAGSGR